MLQDLKHVVWQANMELFHRNMILYTWGNVSGVDRDKGMMIIKPSGVPYETLQPEDMVILDLEGSKVEGRLNPSSDTPTHLVLYNAYPAIGGVVHTHSTWATTFAQAGLCIPCYGTTHADYFYGDIPCTRRMTDEEIARNYEHETGLVILECFDGIDASHMPGVLVNNHGPFSWGIDAMNAVHNAVVMERLALMAYGTMTLSPGHASIHPALLDKHYLRKHGADAYYGQKG